MLKVIYSNRLDRLAAALVDELAAARDNPPDIFGSTAIAVPNHSVATYIKVQTARRLGIAANLTFPFLDTLFERCVADEQRRPLDTDKLHALLIGQLSDDALLAEAGMQPVRAYLQAAGDDADAIELRRFQLAGELASLFYTYALNRPRLIANWPRGTQFGDTSFADTERWQRTLWLRLFGDGGALAQVRDNTGVAWHMPPDLVHSTRPADLTLPDHTFVFGVSFMPPAHVQLLVHLAELTNIGVFALNPCREFWEDLDHNADVLDAPLLRRWGKPARVNVATFNAVTDHEFGAAFTDPVEAGDDHLLARVQSDIVGRAIIDAGASRDAAASIQVLACPNPQRELEVIGNTIWDLMLADDSLRFNDIAVLLAGDQYELYQAHVATVFRELHDIPHHMVDQPLSSESRIAEGLELLLDLPLGTFTRPELLRLLSHPAVLARYPDVDADDWVHWAERLGIVHGADHGDHDGTYIERDLFNWDQGIRRLSLGAFMADDTPVEFGGAAYVPEPLRAEALPSAARLCLLARSLIADARYCRRAELPLSRWRELIDMLATTYLSPVGDDDEHNFDRCRSAIAHLAAADLDGRPVSYRVARELVRQRLGNARSSRGELLADGVMVAPLAVMRPLPFRVVFIAGLGEGKFPSGERHSALDLRRAKPRASDVSPRDRDRFAFLETVLAARDRLFLSWVARNQQSGEALEPASVVQELLSVLGAGYVADADALVTRHPLRRFDPAYFPQLGGDEQPALARNHSRSAHRQARALALRDDLLAHLRARELPIPSPQTLREELLSPARDDLRRGLSLADVPRAHEATSDEPVTISLAVLRRFLESPLQAWAQVVLGLRQTEFDDRIARADEPFATPRLVEVALLRDVFRDHLHSGGDLVAEYNRRAARLGLSGSAPTGVFAELEQQNHRALLTAWSGQLSRARVEADGWHQVAFGRAAEHSTIDTLLPPIRLRVTAGDRELDVDLVGQTELQWLPKPGSLVLASRRTPEDRFLLRGAMDHVAQAAAGIHPGGSHATAILSTGTKVGRLRFAAWSQSEARAYLADVLGDLLGRHHDYLLPCEAVFRARDRGKASIMGDIERLIRSDRKQFSCRFGPVTDLSGLAAPADADAIAARRFGPIIERIEEHRVV